MNTQTRPYQADMFEDNCRRFIEAIRFTADELERTLNDSTQYRGSRLEVAGQFARAPGYIITNSRIDLIIKYAGEMQAIEGSE